MNIGQGKVFEKPAGGSYVATIIDVVDMPQQTVVYNGQPKIVDKVRIQWVLAHINGAPYLDKDGQPMTVAVFPSAVQSAKSKLTKLLTQILNAAPPIVSSTEDLSRLLIGRGNQLFITLDPDTRKPGEFFANVAGIAPLPVGVAQPPVPAGFIRAKDRTQQQAGPQAGQTTQTYASRPVVAAVAPPAVNLNAPAQSTTAPEAF